MILGKHVSFIGRGAIHTGGVLMLGTRNFGKLPRLSENNPKPEKTTHKLPKPTKAFPKTVSTLWLLGSSLI